MVALGHLQILVKAIVIGRLCSYKTALLVILRNILLPHNIPSLIPTVLYISSGTTESVSCIYTPPEIDLVVPRHMP